MAYELPKLPYAYDALEPHIDARTMEIHYTKHHQAYIDNVNKAIKGTDLEKKTVEDLISDLNAVPENIRTVVRNNSANVFGNGVQITNQVFHRFFLKIGAFDRLVDVIDVGLVMLGIMDFHRTRIN